MRAPIPLRSVTFVDDRRESQLLLVTDQHNSLFLRQKIIKETYSSCQKKRPGTVRERETDGIDSIGVGCRVRR